MAVGESFTVWIVNSASSHRNVLPAAPASGMTSVGSGRRRWSMTGTTPRSRATRPRWSAGRRRNSVHTCATPLPASEREMRVVVVPGREAGRVGDQRLAEVVAGLDEPGGGLLGEPHPRLDHDREAAEERDGLSLEVLARDVDPLSEPIDPDPRAADQLAVAVQVQAPQGDPERAGGRRERRRGAFAEVERREPAFSRVLIVNAPQPESLERRPERDRGWLAESHGPVWDARVALQRQAGLRLEVFEYGAQWPIPAVEPDQSTAGS